MVLAALIVGDNGVRGSDVAVAFGLIAILHFAFS
jgi:hypothetical protein